jgi:hypothetical protein
VESLRWAQKEIAVVGAPCHIRVRIAGALDPGWSDWFGGLAVNSAGGRETLVEGDVPDQAAVVGVLARVRDLGLALVALETSQPGGGRIAAPDESGEAPASSGACGVVSGDQPRSNRTVDAPAVPGA